MIQCVTCSRNAESQPSLQQLSWSNRSTQAMHDNIETHKHLSDFAAYSSLGGITNLCGKTKPITTTTTPWSKNDQKQMVFWIFHRTLTGLQPTHQTRYVINAQWKKHMPRTTISSLKIFQVTYTMGLYIAQSGFISYKNYLEENFTEIINIFTVRPLFKAKWGKVFAFFLMIFNERIFWITIILFNQLYIYRYKDKVVWSSAPSLGSQSLSLFKPAC